MSKYIDNFIKNLEEIYNMYDMYVFRYDNCKLDVLIQDNSICFYLYNKDEVIDDFVLDFNIGNDVFYKYMCSKLIIMMYGHVIIHRDENVFDNQRRKCRQRLIVNDDEVLAIAVKMMERQEDVGINWKINISNELYEKLPYIFNRRRFMKKFDVMVEETRDLISARR